MPIRCRPPAAEDCQPRADVETNGLHLGSQSSKTGRFNTEALTVGGNVLEGGNKIEQADQEGVQAYGNRATKIIKAQQRVKRSQTMSGGFDTGKYESKQSDHAEQASNFDTSLLQEARPSTETTETQVVKDGSKLFPNPPKRRLYSPISLRSPSPLCLGSPELVSDPFHSVDVEISESSESKHLNSWIEAQDRIETDDVFQKSLSSSPSQSSGSDRPVVVTSSPTSDESSSAIFHTVRTGSGPSNSDQDEMLLKGRPREISPLSKRIPGWRDSTLVPGSVITGDVSQKPPGPVPTSTNVEETQLLDAKARCMFSHPSSLMVEFSDKCTKEVQRQITEAMSTKLEHPPDKPANPWYQYLKSVCMPFPEELPLIVFPVRIESPPRRSEDGSDRPERPSRENADIPQISHQSTLSSTQSQQGEMVPSQEVLTSNDDGSRRSPVLANESTQHHESRANSVSSLLSEDQSLLRNPPRQSMSLDENGRGSHGRSRRSVEHSKSSGRHTNTDTSTVPNRPEGASAIQSGTSPMYPSLPGLLMGSYTLGQSITENAPGNLVEQPGPSNSDARSDQRSTIGDHDGEDQEMGHDDHSEDMQLQSKDVKGKARETSSEDAPKSARAAAEKIRGNSAEVPPPLPPRPDPFGRLPNPKPPPHTQGGEPGSKISISEDTHACVHATAGVWPVFEKRTITELTEQKRKAEEKCRQREQQQTGSAQASEPSSQPTQRDDPKKEAVQEEHKQDETEGQNKGLDVDGQKDEAPDGDNAAEDYCRRSSTSSSVEAECCLSCGGLVRSVRNSFIDPARRLFPRSRSREVTLRTLEEGLAERRNPPRSRQQFESQASSQAQTSLLSWPAYNEDDIQRQCVGL
ncbi:MAG: hypothetical protein Q9228_002385 [Teloschistes exilis]